MHVSDLPIHGDAPPRPEAFHGRDGEYTADERDDAENGEQPAVADGVDSVSVKKEGQQGHARTSIALANSQGIRQGSPDATEHIPDKVIQRNAIAGLPRHELRQHRREARKDPGASFSRYLNAIHGSTSRLTTSNPFQRRNSPPSARQAARHT